MEAPLTRRLINVDEYHNMYHAGILKDSDRVELIHGEILEITPIGSRHAAMVDRLNNLIVSIADNKGIVRVQNPISINDLNEPEPDLMVLKPKGDFYAEKHPEARDVFIVIEVSDSTYEYDRNIKLPLYASVGVPEFWLVNLEKKEIEVHRSPSKDVYKKIEIARSGDQVDLAFCGKSVEVDQLLG